MKYGKHDHRNYGLEQLQEARELATDPIVKMENQSSIDAYFFGSDIKRKTKKERRRDRKRERQKMREEDYE